METDDNTKNCTEMFIHMKQAGYKEAATAFSPNCEEVHLQDQRFTVGPVVIWLFGVAEGYLMQDWYYMFLLSQYQH